MTAIDSMIADERTIFVRMLAAAALTFALRDIDTHEHQGEAIVEDQAAPVAVLRRRVVALEHS
jgi:hypothetical protein